MIKAKWMMDYDMHSDKCYDRPTCPVCEVPIFNSNGHCDCCDADRELDADMIIWLKEREQTKTDVIECFGCGNKSMKVVYHINPCTKEWQTGHGFCTLCGCRFIV